MGSMCGESVSLWLLLLRIEGIFMASKWWLLGLEMLSLAGQRTSRNKEREKDQDSRVQMMKFEKEVIP
jgi:hypothetical protein